MLLLLSPILFTHTSIRSYPVSMYVATVAILLCVCSYVRKCSIATCSVTYIYIYIYIYIYMYVRNLFSCFT